MKIKLYTSDDIEIMSDYCRDSKTEICNHWDDTIDSYFVQSRFVEIFGSRKYNSIYSKIKTTLYCVETSNRTKSDVVIFLPEIGLYGKQIRTFVEIVIEYCKEYDLENLHFFTQSQEFMTEFRVQIHKENISRDSVEFYYSDSSWEFKDFYQLKLTNDDAHVTFENWEKGYFDFYCDGQLMELF